MNDNEWVKASGRIKVDKKEGRVAVHLGLDICLYYQWLIENELKRCFQIPRHSGHLTICQKTIHKNIDFAAAQQFAGKVINFEYNVNFEIGGRSKGFTCFWLKARSPEVEEIKKKLNVIDGPRFLGDHISLVSDKKMNFLKFQKKMITI